MKHLLCAGHGPRHRGCCEQWFSPCEVEYTSDVTDWCFLGFKSLLRCVLFSFECGVGK